MSVDQDIADLKKKLDEINTKRIQTSTKLTALDEEKVKLLADCKTLGVVDPKKIDEEIKAQEAAIAQELESIKKELEGSHALTA